MKKKFKIPDESDDDDILTVKRANHEIQIDEVKTKFLSIKTTKSHPSIY